jgi:hypothetical protein
MIISSRHIGGYNLCSLHRQVISLWELRFYRRCWLPFDHLGERNGNIHGEVFAWIALPDEPWMSTLFESFCLWLSMKLKEKKISFWIKLERQDVRHFFYFLWCYVFMSNNYWASGLTDINFNKPVTSDILDYPVFCSYVDPNI